MKRHRRRLPFQWVGTFTSTFAAALLASSIFAACSNDSSSTASSPDASAKTGCAAETRGNAYSAGLEKVSASGKLHVRLLSAQPAPPEKGDNVWTVELDDDTGKPIDGASVSMTPFMPDHGHGSAKTPVATPTGEPGKYKIDQIYLPMAGYWEMTVHVGSEQVVFGFCIEG